MDMAFIANGFGVVALIMSVWALTRKDDSHILLILSVSVLLWAVHYFLMGSVTGGVMHIIASAGIFIADRMKSLDWRPKFIVATVFAALNIVVGTLWWTGFSDLFAVAGGVVLGYSQFCFKGQAMRTGFIAGEGIMFGYAASLGSYPGMAVTLINLMAGLVGLWRLTRSQRSLATSQSG